MLGASQLRQRVRPFLEPPTELTAESLWSEVSTRLQGALSTTYSIWFSEVTAVGLSDDAFVLGVPNEFMRDQIAEQVSSARSRRSATT